jgi:hypothetical protein
MSPAHRKYRYHDILLAAAWCVRILLLLEGVLWGHMLEAAKVLQVGQTRTESPQTD